MFAVTTTEWLQPYLLLIVIELNLFWLVPIRPSIKAFRFTRMLLCDARGQGSYCMIKGVWIKTIQ